MFTAPYDNKEDIKACAGFDLGPVFGRWMKIQCTGGKTGNKCGNEYEPGYSNRTGECPTGSILAKGAAEAKLKGIWVAGCCITDPTLLQSPPP